MNQNRVISTAVLFLLLGTTIAAFAQRGQEQKGGGGDKAKPAQHQQRSQQAKQAKPQPKRAQQAKSQPQRAQQVQRQQQPQTVASNRGNNGNHYGRIPDDRYRANFGHAHSFHMMHPQLIRGYNRFQYGGYSFGFNQGWPFSWDYNDYFYVEYVDGRYYMYNLRHPGIHITLNLF